MEPEIWAPIEGFELYQVSTHGNIKHVQRVSNRKLYLNGYGFPCIVLFKGTTKTRYVRQVNQLVATAFLDPPQRGDETSVWHIDGDLTNCSAENLKWDRRDRVMEWNDMHRRLQPQFTTPPVMHRDSGVIFDNAYHAGMATNEIESAVMRVLESYPEHLAYQAKYSYVY